MKKIGKFLALILGSFSFTAIIVFFIAYYFGPGGHYFANNVLIDPESLSSFSYHDKEGKSSHHYVMDKIEYLHFSQSSREIKHIDVSLSSYNQFFKVIKGDRSLVSDDKIASFFVSGVESRLLIKGRPLDRKSDLTSQIFQEITFSSNGNFYRVELRQSDPQSWVYFEHQDIQALANDLFL